MLELNVDLPLWSNPVVVVYLKWIDYDLYEYIMINILKQQKLMLCFLCHVSSLH